MKRIESNNIRFKYLEEQNKILHKKNKELEGRFNARIDSLEKDFKIMFRESEATNREAMKQLVDSVDELTNTFNKQVITEKDERIKEMLKKDKAKNTALYSFVVALLMLVVGTFWDMFIQPMIQMMNGGD